VTEAQSILNRLKSIKITMYRISQDTRISRPTLSSWRKGTHKPSPAILGILKRYAKSKGVDCE